MTVGNRVVGKKTKFISWEKIKQESLRPSHLRLR